MSLPRLTGALRAFAGVTPESQFHQGVDLVSKKRQRVARQAKEGLTWSKLQHEIHTHSDLHRAEVTNELRKVIHLAREIGK